MSHGAPPVSNPVWTVYFDENFYGIWGDKSDATYIMKMPSYLKRVALLLFLFVPMFHITPNLLNDGCLSFISYSTVLKLRNHFDTMYPKYVRTFHLSYGHCRIHTEIPSSITWHFYHTHSLLQYWMLHCMFKVGNFAHLEGGDRSKVTGSEFYECTDWLQLTSVP